jgi:hypothetical protein
MNKHFIARWLSCTTGSTIGNVSFTARSVFEAIQKADKIGREIGLPTSERTIHQDYKEVHHKQHGV